MKKLTKILVLAVLVIASLVSCSEDRVTYVNPFAGKTFYINKGIEYEMSLNFTNSGKAVLTANVLMLKPDADGNYSDNSKLQFEKQTLYEFDYTFTGSSSSLVMTPSKMLAYFYKEVTHEGETERAVTRAELVDKDGYCTVLSDQLKTELETIRKEKGDDVYYAFFTKQGYTKEQVDLSYDTIIRSIAKAEIDSYLFHSQTYKYEFNKRDLDNGLKYVLVLTKQDGSASPGAEKYAFTEVVKN